MRLSDLLSAEVVDEGGQRLGSVHDVRLVQDGPLIGSFGAALRLAGLVVGRRGLGTTLGYARAGAKGPLLLKLLFTRLHSGDRFVPWDRVATVEPGRVTITGVAADLDPPRAVR
jgi:hypothetical protein